MLRLNDDVIVNTRTLLGFLTRTAKSKYMSTNRFFGNVWQNYPPVRDRSSKYYVSYKEFPSSFYPTFCQGSAYIVTGDLPNMLYHESEKMYPSIFSTYLEDVYFGMLAKRLDSQFTNIKANFRDIYPPKVVGKRIQLDVGAASTNLRLDNTYFYYNEYAKDKLIDLRPIWELIMFMFKEADAFVLKAKATTTPKPKTAQI